MSYSQKYTLVSFINPITVGAEFAMEDWPLHITLADVFAIDMQSTDIETQLAVFFSNQARMQVSAGKESTLGAAEIVLIEPTNELVNLHTSIVDLLEENGAIFNNPEFTRAGFLPHSTIQRSGRLFADNTVTLHDVALIDMFPKGDWQQRKALNIFEFRQQ